MSSVTTSIRLEAQLSNELKKVSHKLHRGKSWIIAEALAEYLTKYSDPNLIKEAKRQSLLVSKVKKSVAEVQWEENTDTSGWT